MTGSRAGSGSVWPPCTATSAKPWTCSPPRRPPPPRAQAWRLLEAATRAYRDVGWRAATLKITLEQIGAERGLKLGKAQAPVRVAVTGRTVGLPLFESLEVLGRERTLARLEAALE